MSPIKGDTDQGRGWSSAGWWPAGEVLPASFFARDSNEVARELVGKIIWRSGYGGGRLSEVEAYLPVGDPASHAACGRTERNAAMFGAPGHLYVFMSYGVHNLLNLVCEERGVGSAVLLRSYEPLVCGDGSPMTEGVRGPGVLGRALGIELGMSGRALGEDSGVAVFDDGVPVSVGQTTRVGISSGRELPLRHYLVGSGYISSPRPTGGRRQT